MITTKLLSTLIPIKPERCDRTEIKEAALCRNEAFSFQMAYKILDDSEKSTAFYVKLDTDLPVNCYYQRCVPVLHADFLTIEPVQPIGMYPDVLMPKKVNAEMVHKHLPWGSFFYEKDEKLSLCAYNDSWQALWFSVNENAETLAAGQHKIKISLYNRLMELVGENELELEVMDVMLPEQTFLFTNWFHHDCLADYYGLEIFSDEYFTVMRNFVRKAAINGMNMILTPAFTPPLDTPIDTERKTAQLVKIKKTGDQYTFDFSLLKRFMDICREEGITHFEHSHLFTQWGAEHAPKIVAEVDGKETRIFGWDTEATGEEYVTFLRTYLPELQKFLKAEGLEKNILFHISDEPTDKNRKTYTAAKEGIKDLLEGYMVGDALEEYEFYESGLVQTPIVKTIAVDNFVGKGDNIWCYYTGAEVNEGMNNRLIQLPRERQRFIGIQMYYNNIKGFLHWAYNFYYNEFCNGFFDPNHNPCGGYPNAGTSYFVYPTAEGTANQSVRQKLFGEALIDMRALTLLENLSGRKVADELIETYFGAPTFRSCPDNPEVMIRFRSAVNDKIKEAIRK